MASRFLKISAKIIPVVIEGAILIFCLFIAALIGLAWRLSAGPLDMGFAKNYIEKALYDAENDYSVTLDDVVLSWPDLEKPFMLSLKGAMLMQHGRTVVAVEEAQLGLSGPYLVAAQIVPVSLTITGPSLHLVRSPENEIGFNLSAETTETQEDGSALEDILAALSEPRGSRNRSPLARMQRLEISDARLVMEDHVLGTTWFLPQLDLQFIRKRHGLAFQADIRLPGGRNHAAQLGIDAVYEPKDRTITSMLHIRDFDPRIVTNKINGLDFMKDLAVYLNGDIKAVFDSQLKVKSLAADLSAKDGTIMVEGLYDKPVPYQDIALTLAYDGEAGLVELPRLQATIDTIALAASTSFTMADTFTIPLSLSLSDFAIDRLDTLWPAGVEETSAKKWLVDRLSLGTVEKARARLDLAVEKKNAEWSVDLADMDVSFALANMSVDYSAPLRPATQAQGHGTIKGDVLDITLESALLGDLTVTEGSILINKIGKEEPGEAAIEVDVNGPLASVFDYIASEPIGMTGEELGLKTDQVKGEADLDIKIAFPTEKDLPKEKVIVKAEGTLTEVLLPDVVKTLDLSGGPLKLTVGDGAVELSGKASLEGRPLDLTWMQYLDSTGKEYSARVTADIVSDDALRKALGVEITDWIEGTVPVNAVYTDYAGNKSSIAIKGTTNGARVKIQPFNYEKPAGAPGTLSATALLEDGVLTELKDLAVKTPELDLSKAGLKFRDVKGESVFTGGSFPFFKLKETDAAVIVDVGANEQLKIRINGAFFDARPFIGKDKPRRDGQAKNNPPIAATVDVARLRTDDGQLVQQAKIKLDMSAQGLLNELSVDATAGQGPLYLRLLPDGQGQLSFEMNAADAGATLRAFGVYENIIGGKLAMKASSKNAQEKHTLVGKAVLSDFRVIKAPVLAGLISAINPLSLPDLLSGEGLYFSRLQSLFTWQLRPSGDLYIVKEGRTSGSSIGLTFEGAIDKAKNITAIKGHVVPMSQINNLIGKIPVIGDILTGGKGGAIFAATYEISGPADNPKVSVNPLSVLAPGIIRNILFEGEGAPASTPAP